VLLVAAAWASVALGCSVPIANDLDEGAANKVVAVLGENGVAADKSRDPGHEGRFSVDVGRGDVGFALSLMAREELPPRVPPGLAEALDEGALIPSRADEHARRLLGTAGELSRSLQSVEGVIAAHVHLAATPTGPLDDGQASTPTASVLLKHRGPEPPLGADDVRRLVAGAVPGMSPHAVVVVNKAMAEPKERQGTELVRLGPLTTTRSSLPYLRWMIACVATLNACMVALLFAMWLRGKRISPPADGNGQAAAAAPPR
jgi:type III secretion system YscJ/HrcJ family lipoprotein